MRNDIYPCVITLDRYSGVYSGGRWTAFNSEVVPMEAMGDDVTCGCFWTLEKQMEVGLGDTPDMAYEDLREKRSKIRKQDSEQGDA